VALHAHAVAKNGTAGERAGWIDGQNADGLVARSQQSDQLIDQRAVR